MFFKKNPVGFSHICSNQIEHLNKEAFVMYLSSLGFCELI